MLLNSVALQLVELFGNVRDDWIKRDLHGWLDANEIYPGVAEDLAAIHQRHELYIVTTKQVAVRHACQSVLHSCLPLQQLQRGEGLQLVRTAVICPLQHARLCAALLSSFCAVNTSCMAGTALWVCCTNVVQQPSCIIVASGLDNLYITSKRRSGLPCCFKN